MLSQPTAASFNFADWRRTVALIFHRFQTPYHHLRARLAVLDKHSSPAFTGSRLSPATVSVACPLKLPGRPALYLLRKLDCYLPWQVCRHDCARISQLLRQGPLNVTGHARRQDASSFEHFVRHASTPPVFCPLTPFCANALKLTIESSATQNSNFMDLSS